ncbi:MAG: anaerobic ribonucleoside triphosphate reductase [Clostridiales bacterium]|nr:anaerobic ribonucleoside triphosphate reductase [Clostridiales bacterium]
MYATAERTAIAEIIKRDGRRTSFNPDKIAQAIKKAFISKGEPASDALCAKLAEFVTEEAYFRYDTSPTVEQVQDLVEEILMKEGYSQVAKAYILYRAERTRVRESKTRLMRVFEDITFSSSKDSDVKRENANVNGDTAMGTMLKYGSEGAKAFYQAAVLKPEHSKAHSTGDIHIHDLDFLTTTTTCCQIDLVTLFKDGFGTGHGKLREPSEISSYSALACIAIQSNQNDQHGGQSIPNFDYALAQGVKKTFRKRYRQNMARFLEAIAATATEAENLTNIMGGQDAAGFVEAYSARLIQSGLAPAITESPQYEEAETAVLRLGLSESAAQKARQFARKNALAETDQAVYQAMEALVHNLNTMNSRAGAQTPFSSINYGLDTSDEGRMVIKNVLLTLDAGLGAGETPIFPIHIFRVKEGVNYNEGEPNHDLFELACRVSAKRMYPNFSFIDAPFNLQYYRPGRPETEVAYMGCRTRVISNVYDRENEVTFGRGNLSYTSVNLPRIALRSLGDRKWFYRELDKKIDLIIDQLLERFKIQSAKKVRNFPFLMGQGVWLGSDKLSIEDTVGDVLKHGTLSVGFIGLAEALTALTGKHHGESEEAQQLGLDIIGHIRKRMDAESEKRDLNFTLIATPAEGLSGRFALLDQALFGAIKGVTDKKYYTNSFHIPVGFHISAYDKIRLEAPYHALTNAGHITYVELDGDLVKNQRAFTRIIRFMKESGVGYGSINHPVDHDPVCGFTGVIDDQCPVCGRKEEEGVPFQRIRRITGYLVSSIEKFNNAKLAELKERVKHGLDPQNSGNY